MRTHSKLFSCTVVITIAAFMGMLTACGGEYDTRCDEIKQKVQQCFPGNEVSPEAMCSQDLLDLYGPLLGADCGYLHGGKADDKWLWALGGLVVGGALVYGANNNNGGWNNNGGIPWRCQGNRCGQNGAWCMSQGIRCPGPNGFNPNYNPGFGPGNMPWQCQAPQCQNQPWNVQQQCQSQGFPCHNTWNNNGWNNNGNTYWQCQFPQCQNQPWNVKQQCQNMGHFCNNWNNNNNNNFGWW